MGYIHEFEVKLTELLAEVDEATRTDVLTYVKRTVVESYKNGIEAGKAAAIVRAAEHNEAPAGHGSRTYESQRQYTPRGNAGYSQRREPPRREHSAPASGVELIADEITAEVMDVIAMYTHNNGEA